MTSLKIIIIIKIIPIIYRVIRDFIFSLQWPKENDLKIDSTDNELFFLQSLLESNTFFIQAVGSISPSLRHKSWHGQDLFLWPLITILLLIPQHCLHFICSSYEWDALCAVVKLLGTGPSCLVQTLWPWQWLPHFFLGCKMGITASVGCQEN